MDVFLGGKRIRLNPKQAFGKGGEADVFDIGKAQALKLFKSDQHPDYQGMPQEQQAARVRLKEHQRKLPQFPKYLPDRVIQPQALVTDKSGKTVLGYTMPLLRDAEVLLKYSERNFRQAGIAQQTVIEIFRDLHTTVSKLHFCQVVIGDFNDLNVLVKDKEAHLIDADSFQFGPFITPVFTARFVDPLQCNPQQNQPILTAPHTPDSDWYAFTIMLMQSLLFVHPYGGVYQPSDPTQRIPHEARPLHRITVFNPAVKYPKPALPYKLLPDDLLHYFHQVFEQDLRGEFPRSQLDSLLWKTCPTCGVEHARVTCPTCLQAPASAPKSVTVVRGQVIATRCFRTEGVILAAALNGNQLHWLYWERGAFKREDGTTILQGDLDPQLQFGLQGRRTLLGKQGQVVRLSPDGAVEALTVDTYGQQSMFGVNAQGRYWLQNGQLLRDGKLGPDYIGDVLPERTQFWIGPTFGFGFYRAAELSVAFVFDAVRLGLNDQVQLPRWQGQVIEATCAFSDRYCWFSTALQQQQARIHRCVVLDRSGDVVAQAEATPGDGNLWLGTLSGKCAVQSFLLVATDEGVVRMEVQQGQVVQGKEFPDTEPFVNANSRLFAAQSGLYVVNQSDIQLLKIN